MTTDARVASPVVRIAGAEIDDPTYESLVEVRVEQSVHVPDAVTLRLLDPDFAVFDGGVFDVGREISVAMEAGSGPTMLAEAEITSVSIAPGMAGRHEVTVLALDKAHRLARVVKRRTFADLTDSDIASQIASDYGLRGDVDATSTTYPYLAQSETDYSFLSLRAMLTGRTWWVADNTLYFKKSANTGTGPRLTWGDNLHDFRARFTASEASDEIEVRGWDFDQQQPIVGSAKPQRSGIDILGSTAPAAKDLTVAASDAYLGKRYTGRWAVQDAAEAKTIAEALAFRATAAEVTAKGEAEGDPRIRAGEKVAVEAVGDRLTGSYLLTSVEHILNGGKPYITRFVAGAAEASELADLLGGRQVNAAWNGAAPTIGVVTNIKDEERPGRIRVRFPTFSDEEESEWARMVAPGAGKERGWQLTPEVDDEVLVVFEQGDPRRPLIVGGLWSKKNPPPTEASSTVKDGKGVAGGFRSRTGHVIEILEGDSEQDQRIRIALGDGETEFILGADGVTLDAPTDVSITTKGSFSVKADKDVTIEGQNVTIKAKSKAAVEGTDVAAKGNSSISLEGSTAELKGSASAKVDGGGMTEVKGGLVKLN